MRLTLEEVAKKIGSTKAYVWELENKETARPSAEKLLKIADALELSPDFLLSDDRHKPEVADQDKVFFRKFSRLSDADKQIIRMLATGMKSEKK